MFLAITLTAYYFYFFWFEHSFNICIGQPKCSTGRREASAWLGIFLRGTHLVVFWTFHCWEGERLGWELWFFYNHCSSSGPSPQDSTLRHPEAFRRKSAQSVAIQTLGNNSREEMPQSSCRKHLFLLLPWSVSLANALAALPLPHGPQPLHLLREKM